MQNFNKFRRNGAERREDEIIIIFLESTKLFVWRERPLTIINCSHLYSTFKLSLQNNGSWWRNKIMYVSNRFFFNVCNFKYNELSQKTRFQFVPIAALYLYNIQRENLVFKILSVSQQSLQHIMSIPSLVSWYFEFNPFP